MTDQLFPEAAAPKVAKPFAGMDIPQRTLEGFHCVNIGPHRLYLGDAYEIRPLLGWQDADVMDPPYEFESSGGGAWRAARGATDQIGAEGLDQGFDMSIIDPSRCGAVAVFFHGNQLEELGSYLKARFRRRVQMHWIKENPTPHRRMNYLADIEDWFMAYSEDAMQDWFHAWHRGYHPTGDHHDMHRHVTALVQPSSLFGHPTVKPDSVMNKIMRNMPGVTVCDPFMGTGSTGCAAIRAGKTFTGIEYNQKHFETAVRRVTSAYKEN
jgi:DNA methylase